MRTHPTATGARRSGFTLIELLVVNGILALLTALTIGAVRGVLAGQVDAANEQVLQKLDNALGRHWKAVVDQSRRERIPDQILVATNREQREAQVLWAKLKLRSEFPTTFAEARRAYLGIPPKRTYVAALAGATSASPEEEAAVCLALALSQNRRGVTFSAERDLGEGNVKQRNIGGKDFRVFTDAHDNLITYVRWPYPAFASSHAGEYNDEPYATVRQEDLNHDGTKEQFVIDPVDPEVFLRKYAGGAGLDTTVEQAIGHELFNPASGQFPENFYPFILSAGVDGTFNTNDDMPSYKTRQSGRRGDS